VFVVKGVETGNPGLKEINLAVPVFLHTLEESSLSTWIRASPSIFAYWFILTWHAIGMGLAVGASAVIDLRLLGVAREMPIAPLKKLYPLLWVGFWIQVVSGLLLIIAYPTKALTNPVFYTKLALIGIAMVIMRTLYKRIFVDPSQSDESMMIKGKNLATWSLVCWVGAMTAGRFLAYTFNYLMYPEPGEAAFLHSFQPYLKSIGAAGDHILRAMGYL